MLNMTENCAVSVPEDKNKLKVISGFNPSFDFAAVTQSLKEDQVVLVRNVEQSDIDSLILNIAEQLGLRSSLELHAGFAEVQGHRKKMSKYYMSVNKRREYQLILPHSEGSSFQNVQLVSFYCHENTTDGGDTILMNVDRTSDSVWGNLRERVVRGRVKNKILSHGEIAEIKMRYQIKLPEDALQPDDQILKESHSHLAELDLVDVLARPKKTFSKILNKNVYAYWSSMSRFDSDSYRDFSEILRQSGLYKEPVGASDHESSTDGHSDRGIWSSGVSYDQLFKRKISIRLEPDDFILMNNLTWTHGVSNWTPGSGSRVVAAAMA